MVLPFAFEMLALRKLQVRCAAENVRSQRVGESCGFKVEGVLRNDFVIADGRTLIDIVYSGMTDSDYRTLRVKPPVVGGFR